MTMACQMSSSGICRLLRQHHNVPALNRSIAAWCKVQPGPTTTVFLEENLRARGQLEVAGMEAPYAQNPKIRKFL